jgi:hypothetical protein
MATDKDYQAAADWAEHEMGLKPHSTTARRGAAAGEFGRELVERALAGRCACRRTSIDSSMPWRRSSTAARARSCATP